MWTDLIKMKPRASGATSTALQPSSSLLREAPHEDLRRLPAGAGDAGTWSRRAHYRKWEARSFDFKATAIDVIGPGIAPGPSFA